MPKSGYDFYLDKCCRLLHRKSVTICCEMIVDRRLHGSSYGDASGQTRTNYRGKINFINLQGSHPYHITTPEGGGLTGWRLTSLK